MVVLYVQHKNRWKFKLQNKVIFLLWGGCYICMILSTIVTTMSDEKYCYVESLSMVLISQEEAFVMVIYFLLVFRMLNVYHSINKGETDEETDPILRRIGKIVECQNWFISIYFLIMTVFSWMHYF